MRLLARLFVIPLIGIFCSAASADILFSLEGPLSKNTTLAQLKKYYGEANVRESRIHLGEGFYEMGTVLFPSDSKKKVLITWKNKERTRPARVYIRNDSTGWKTQIGLIGIGSTLSEIEALNGRPFVLAGHSWDYAGTVLSWKDGTLAREFERPGARILLRLGGDWSVDKNFEVAGDGDYTSSHPIMKKVNPRVYEIVIGFD